MEKTKLNRFISKYFLNGSVESVVWHSNGALSVQFVDDTKSLVGDVVCENSKFPTCEFGINQTSKLKALLTTVGENIDINVRSKENISTVMDISDTSVDINYMLSDISIIPKVPNLKKLPEWDLALTIDEAFSETFIKASSALSDVKEFAVITKNDKVNFVIGHSNVNTTKVAINIEPKTFKNINVIYFSASHLKEILTANKDAKIGKLEVSEKGLAKLTFNVDDFKSTYYLISRQDINV